jgi:hypothetical protein
MERYARADGADGRSRDLIFSPQMGSDAFNHLAAAGAPDEALVFIDVPPWSRDYSPLSPDYPSWAKLYESARSDPRLHLSRPGRSTSTM